MPTAKKPTAKKPTAKKDKAVKKTTAKKDVAAKKSTAKKAPVVKKSTVKKNLVEKKPVKATKKISKKNLKKDDNFIAVNSDDVLVTHEGLQKLKDELKFLETDKRQQIAKHLQEAIAYGDLSENSEYAEAKEEQAFTEGRILELHGMIKHAKIITDQHVEVVNLGSNVDLENKTLKQKEKYTLVGSTEADPFSGKVSNESLLGQGMLGKKKGDKFSIDAPRGKFDYSIIKVS